MLLNFMKSKLVKTANNSLLLQNCDVKVNYKM